MRISNSQFRADAPARFHPSPDNVGERTLKVVATIGQMASAEYYLESQRSYRHPNEYYTAGEEPDGTWFNPNGLFGLKDGAKVDTGEFQRLYNGFAPDGARQARAARRNPSRSPGVDMTFSVDKSVSSRCGPSPSRRCVRRSRAWPSMPPA